MPRRNRLLSAAKFLIAAFAPLAASAASEVSFLFCYDPDHPENPSTRRIIELAKADSEIKPV